jgi:hypothetical protein
MADLAALGTQFKKDWGLLRFLRDLPVKWIGIEAWMNPCPSVKSVVKTDGSRRAEAR